MSTLENAVLELEALFPGEGARELGAGNLPPALAQKSAGLILESETALSMGGPGVPSARLLLYSSAPMPQGDRIVLAGSDLSELRGTVPFAEAAVLHGKNVTAEVFYRFVQRHKRLLDQPGFMVKTMKDEIWCRADAQAKQAGLAEISRRFLARVHEAFPEVEAIDLRWVTGHPEAVGQLADAARRCEETVTAIKAGVWKDRGFDYKSCQLAGHCGDCGDKKTCASVRQMEAKVRMKRRREAAAAAA